MTETHDSTDTRTAAIAGLRQLAYFLEHNPAIPMPSNRLLARVNREQLALLARNGGWRKEYMGDFFSLVKEFPGGLELDLYTDRVEVCRKIVTGTRVVPAQPATPERTEDVEEWVCKDSLLGGAR